MNPLNCKHRLSNKFWHNYTEYARCVVCKSVKKVEGDHENNNSIDLSYNSRDLDGAVATIGEYIGRYHM
jgi:hypothetical protein